MNFNAIIKQKSIHVGERNQKLNTRCLGLRRVLFLIFKIHLYQIIWLSAILAFRFAFSRLHSSGLLHVTGSLANARLRPTKNLAPFHNFYKIVPLRSVFAPVEFSSKTLTSPINYFALYSEAGSLPRLKLRTAYAFFLTIRQADFPLKRTLPCTAQPFRLRLQEELLNGRSPGERTDRAGLCKAHKARLCELERNPRRPPNPQPVI